MVGLVEHGLGVAVIRGDQHFAAVAAHRLDDPPEAFVEHFDRLGRRREIAGVADHVAVGVVADDRIEPAAGDRRHQLFGELVRAHLGLQVVGRNFGRGHQHALLAGIGGFDAAVEEIGDVRVLLGLGDAQLPEPLRGDVFAETVADVLRQECRRQREVRAVAGQRAVVTEFGNAAARKAAEPGIGERARHLAGAVGAEIHEHHRITVAHRRGRRDRGRLHELVVLAARIGLLERGQRIGRLVGRLALREQVVGGLHAFPALVAVHRIVASDDGGNAPGLELRAFVPQQRDGRGSTPGWRVAPVEEGVHAHVRDTGRGRQFDHGGDLQLVAVDPTRRQQPEDVQCRAIRARGGGSLIQHRIGEKLAVFNRGLNARVILVNHATRPDVEVADFGIAHLRGGQADPFFRGVDGGMRAGPPPDVPVRLARQADRVVVARLAVAEAVEYDQQRRRYVHDLQCFL